MIRKSRIEKNGRIFDEYQYLPYRRDTFLAEEA